VQHRATKSNYKRKNIKWAVIGENVTFLILAHPIYSDKQNFGREFVKQKLTIKDTTAAWKVAIRIFETGLGLEFDAQISGTKSDHEKKVNKAKKRKRQPKNDALK